MNQTHLMEKKIVSTIVAILSIALSNIALADAASETIALVKNAKTDCFNCHQIDKKIVGPALTDIAARYKGDSTAKAMLVAKVIKGGSGHWNDQTGGLPMTPHPVKPSKDEIDQIISSILKL